MSQPSQRQLSRRNLFAGASAVGAAAAAVTLLPAVRDPSPASEPKKEPPARGGGYHLSEHVLRYFQTTRI